MWCETVLESFNGYRRVIYDKTIKEVVTEVEHLDKRYVEGVIKKHNEALSREYEQGLREGINIKS